jgi:fluoride exporter
MSMSALLAVAAGGVTGAVARYLVYVAVGHLLGTGFPYATLLVNVVGSFVMGVLVELMALVWSASIEMRLFLTTGILGAFTTFSSFSLDFAVLYERRALRAVHDHVVRPLGRRPFCRTAPRAPPCRSDCLGRDARECLDHPHESEDLAQAQRVIDRGVDVAAGDGVAHPEQLEVALGLLTVRCGRPASSASRSISPRFKDCGLSSKYSSSAGRVPCSITT